MGDFNGVRSHDWPIKSRGPVVCDELSGLEELVKLVTCKYI